MRKSLTTRSLIRVAALCVMVAATMTMHGRTTGHASLARTLQSPCYADPGGPYGGTTGQSIQFDSSSSVINWDGCCVNYRWAFGDGTSINHPMPTHTYSSPGTYTVTLTLTHTYFPGWCRTATTAVISN
jgi:PKD domain